MFFDFVFPLPQKNQLLCNDNEIKRWGGQVELQTRKLQKKVSFLSIMLYVDALFSNIMWNPSGA